MALKMKNNEIRMFGVFGEDFTSEDFMDVLDSQGGDDISIYLQSIGGSVSDGMSIYNQLRSYPGQVDITVDATAASIATVVMMAGDNVTVHSNSLIMVHDPWALAIGNASEFRGVAEVLDILAQQIAEIYSEKTGTSKSRWLEMMAKETYFNADEAIEAGLADAIVQVEEKAQNKNIRAIATATVEQANAAAGRGKRRNALAAKIKVMKAKRSLTR